MKISKQIFTELIWLAFSLVLTILLSISLFGKNILGDSVDIHLHDTYFVINSFPVLMVTFLLITFLIFFVKEFRKSFRHALPNWILVVAGLVLIISLTFLIKMFSGISNGSMNIEPSLSKVSGLTQDSVTQFIANFFTVLQFLIMSVLLFVAYCWGKGKKKSKN